MNTEKKITRRLVTLAIEMQRPGYLAERMTMYRQEQELEQNRKNAHLLFDKITQQAGEQQ